MAYITREDGEHFVIPSYRDVLSAKQKNTLKKDILLLSQSYGELITLQRKSASQFEVAFSPDSGYLLGESIWHYFKRPLDMVYCEIIPNTTEAILVIVKAGSVYLDGSFPLDSIPEELVIFLTQQNNFEIYIYGNVPISETPEEGKFSFEGNSVRSFTVLEKPVFPTLPLLKIYQLQPVDVVLRSQGIGVFPVKTVLIGVIGIIALWMFWSYMTNEKEVPPPPPAEVNPYLAYNTALNSPAPSEEIQELVKNARIFFALPGWEVQKLHYEKGTVVVGVQSQGGKVDDLFQWAKNNGAGVEIKTDGIYVTLFIKVPSRPIPNKIYPLKQILAQLVDNLGSVYPGNNIKLGEFANKGAFTQVTVTISIDGISPDVLALIGKQLKDLPVVLQNVNVTVEKGSLTGLITLDALGS